MTASATGGARGEGPLTLTELAGLDVAVLKGVGTRKRRALEAMGIGSVLDLLMHYPRRYLDRTRQARIAELVPGEQATVIGTVTSVAERRSPRRGTRWVEAVVTDGTGRLRLTFFNQPWRVRQLAEGTTVALFGTLDVFRGRPQMTNPVVDLIGDRTGRIIPVYPQSERAGVTSWEIGEWVAEALRRCRVRTIGDPVPAPVRRRLDLMDRHGAFVAIHRPGRYADHVRARRRLAFDELLRVQLALVSRKRALERSGRGIAHPGGGALLESFWGRLPFEPTPAQRRAVAEITADLTRPVPMHRLLQGDVGAGKTVVAAFTMLVAVQGGRQAALMAPTEVLAEQHHGVLGRLFEGMTVPEDSLLGERPLRVELLSQRLPAARRRRVTEGLADGTVDIVVGTHALLSEGVAFADLGVVVVDEQHRFGVDQRAALRDKGDGTVPDVLVMTATPIPRTAAMTVYGDLDVSVLDAKPPGRTPVRTRRARTPEEEGEVWAHVRAEVAAGHQAYVVCPLVEESDRLEARSAEEVHATLTAPGGPLEGLRVGLLHGRVGVQERELTMDLFRSGGLDVLVATTVIEVGVDVPNATVMVILDADRFGIAQLHQLRGRVGRGDAPSVCWLVSGVDTPEAEARLGALVATDDGFELAEVDLRLRGEGTLMGDRQTGRTDLRLASLATDADLVAAAREVAFELVDPDQGLAAHPELAAEVRLLVGSDAAEYLLKS